MPSGCPVCLEPLAVDPGATDVAESQGCLIKAVRYVAMVWYFVFS